jgi:hypothetical protein
MIMLTLALMTTPAINDDIGYYRCRNLGNDQSFDLIYVYEQDRVTEVALRVEGVPNLPDDSSKWNGVIEPTGVSFSYEKDVKGSVTLGEMLLKHNLPRGQSASLTWQYKLVAGDRTFEEPEQKAVCNAVAVGLDSSE